MNDEHEFYAVQCDSECGCNLLHLFCRDEGCDYTTVADGWPGCNEAKHTHSELTRAVEEARLESAKTLHHNIDVMLNLIERIQPGYQGSPQIDARDLQRVLCEYENDLKAAQLTPKQEGDK